MKRIVGVFNEDKPLVINLFVHVLANWVWIILAQNTTAELKKLNKQIN